MRTLLFIVSVILLSFSSCYIPNGDDGDDRPVLFIGDLRVNHYKSTAIFYSFDTNLGVEITVQEGSDIGSDRKFNSYPYPIENFEFEQGFIQDLKVQVMSIENPLADGSSIVATVLEVVSKTAVPPETTFTIQLTTNNRNGDFTNWITNDAGNFSIINSNIIINCGNLCDELVAKIENKEQLTGVFIHGEENIYVLQEILNE